MPVFISKPLRGHDPTSEVQVAKALEQLSDDWYVIHSVAWQGERRNRQGDGEADFALISKDAGVIILEVKGGEEIEVRSGKWYSKPHGKDAFKKIENPFEQAAAAKSKLFKWLNERVTANVPTMHGVVFPGTTPSENLGPAATAEIIIDRTGIHDMPSAISKLVAYWKMSCKLDDKDVKQVLNLLAPTTVIRRTIADEAYDAEHALIKLTDEQRRVFAGLKRARRAVVYGGPGTGKTLLAAEKACQSAEDGRRTLFVCYNKLLGQALRNSKQLADVNVSTFHSICLSAARNSSFEIPNPIPQSWWEVEAPYCLVESADENKFDTIIVDEGQDFSEDWIQALFALLSDSDNSMFYIFADADQRLWSRSWEPQPDWVPFDLTINCRNTKPIAECVAGVLATEIDFHGASGPLPKWSTLKPKADVSAFVCDLVADLIDDGFETQDIVVLCENAKLANTISQMTAGNASCCRYGGSGIVVETVARFKGLDAAAIVLALDNDASSPDTSAYVGFSRARTYLHIVGPNERKRTSNWIMTT